MANWGSAGGFGDSAKAAREARVRSDTKRDVRRQKRAGEAWEGHDLELTPCVACQVPNERGQMYTGARGLVCEGCFGGDEGRIQAPRSPSLLVPVLLPAVYAFALSSSYLFPSAKYVLICMLSLPVFLGTPLLVLEGMTRCRQALRSAMYDEASVWPIWAAWAWHTVALISMSLLFVVYPWLG